MPKYVNDNITRSNGILLFQEMCSRFKLFSCHLLLKLFKKKIRYFLIFFKHVMYLHCANSKNQTTHKLSIRIHWQRVQRVGKLKKRTLGDYTIRRAVHKIDVSPKGMKSLFNHANYYY